MKRNALTTAIGAALAGAVGMASVASAEFDGSPIGEQTFGQQVSPEGVGSVLIYPYYTMRGGNDTLISVVNTSSNTVAAKVRFLEALNSREVLDFNLYLSPWDVWTAAITEQDGVPGILTNDTSCTAPYLQGGELDGDGNPVPVFQEFLNFEFTTNVQTNDPSVGINGRDFRFDGGPQGDERMGSGYIEVIEMGVLDSNANRVVFVDGDGDDVTWNDLLGTSLAGLVKHGANRVPASCGTITALWANPNFWGGLPGLGVSAPQGNLAGSASIVNVADGTQFGYDPVAIRNFWNVFGGPANALNQANHAHARPGTIYPTIAGDLTPEDNRGNPNALSGTSFRRPGVPVLATGVVLSKANLFNEYVVDGIADARTEWVMTFPTKRFHTDTTDWRLLGGNPLVNDNPIPPFTSTWSLRFGPGGASYGNITGFSPACEELTFSVYDREEQTASPTRGEIVVSPEPPGQDRTTFNLCREANVIRFAGDGDVPETTELFGEINYEEAPGLDVTNFTGIAELGFESGWVNFNLTNWGIGAQNERFIEWSETFRSFDDGILGTRTNFYRQYGLPVVGFAANTFFNGVAADTLRNYGSAFTHKGSRRAEVSFGEFAPES